MGIIETNVTSKGDADRIVKISTVHASIVIPDTDVAQKTTWSYTSDPPGILDISGDDIVKVDGEGDDTANMLGAIQMQGNSLIQPFETRLLVYLCWYHSKST